MATDPKKTIRDDDLITRRLQDFVEYEKKREYDRHRWESNTAKLMRSMEEKSNEMQNTVRGIESSLGDEYIKMRSLIASSDSAEELRVKQTQITTELQTIGNDLASALIEHANAVAATDTKPAVIAELTSKIQELHDLQKNAENTETIVNLKLSGATEGDMVDRLNRITGKNTVDTERMMAERSNGQTGVLNIRNELRNLSTLKNNIMELQDVFNKGVFRELQKFAKNVTDVISNPMIAVVLILDSVVDRFMEIDNAAADLRKNTTLTMDQSRVLEKNIVSISRNYGYMGVDAASVAAASNTLVDNFSGVLPFVESMQKDMVLFSTATGVSNENVTKAFKTLVGISSETTESAKNAMLFAKELSAASGVPLGQIMSDVASASEETMIFVGKTGLGLVKAATEARRLGTTIGAVSSSMSSMTDFQGSIRKEMELSVLLGKHINLGELRRAAYTKDAAGYMVVLKKKLEEVGDISKMSVFQQKSLADAMGLSVEELRNISAQQERMKQLEKTDPELYKKYKSMLEMKKDEVENVAKTVKEEMRKNEMLSRQERLMTSISGITGRIVDLYLPAFMTIFELLIGFFELINKGLTWMDEGISSVLGKFIDIDGKTTDIIKSIGSVVLLVTSLLLVFGKLNGVVGMITGSLFKLSNLNTVFSKITEPLGALFKFGKKSPIGDLVDDMNPTKIKPVASSINSLIAPIRRLIAALSKGIGVMLAFGAAALAVGAAAWMIGKGIESIAKVDTDKISVFFLGLISLLALLVIGTLALATAAAPVTPILLVLGAAFLLLGGGIWMAGKGIAEMVESFTKAGDSLKIIGDIIVNVVLAGFLGIRGVIEEVTNSIINLSNVDPSRLMAVAVGIGNIGIALAGFAGGTFLTKLASFVPGKGPFDSLLELAESSSKIENIATGLMNIIGAMDTIITTGETTAKAIDLITESVDKLSESLKNLPGLKLGLLAAAIGVSKIGGDNKKDDETVESKKLQELIDLMKNGGIAVYLDSLKVNRELARASG